MRVTWLHTKDDGESAFTDLEIPTTTRADGHQMTEYLTAESISFRSYVPNELDYHPAPRRQFIVMVTGSMEIEVVGGDKRTLKPGDIALADDTDGHGHITRYFGTGFYAVAGVPKSMDLTSWVVK